jgi:hypothetical protein
MLDVEKETREEIAVQRSKTTGSREKRTNVFKKLFARSKK